MKRFLTVAVVTAFVLGLIGTVQALNIGSKVKSGTQKAAKGAAKGQVQKEYNKKLSKEKCKFEAESTTQYSGCNIDKIIAELNGFRNAAEKSGFASDVNILVETYGPDWTTARERAEFVRDKVKAQVSSSWDYQVRYSKAPSNEVLFQVEVR